MLKIVGTASAQLKLEKSGFLAPKRRPMKHLDFGLLLGLGVGNFNPVCRAFFSLISAPGPLRNLAWEGFKPYVTVCRCCVARRVRISCKS
jgi:hypothetical protein